MKRWFLAVLTIVLINVGIMMSANAAAIEVREDLGEYFTKAVAGTFIMYDEAKDQYIVFNESQSTKRLSPCSTFKIYNSLAGLETGVLDKEDKNTVFAWNGKQYSFSSWNHDQTLASATRDSVVWYFQELASRIGKQRMQAYLDKIGYGNKDISGGPTFWLDSSLEISAREQVDLLHSLYAGNLPVSPQNVEIVKRNITLAEDATIRFMGKTGSGFQDGKWIVGWFVGCVEKQGHRYFFATNMEAPDGVTGPIAREITKSILKELSIL